MSPKLTQEEVAILIRAQQISNQKGVDKNANVSSICKEAEISRKTGYQWADKFTSSKKTELSELEDKVKRLENKIQFLEKVNGDLDFENRGRKLAWEIHGVDELLEAKKNTTSKARKKKR